MRCSSCTVGIAVGRLAHAALPAPDRIARGRAEQPVGRARAEAARIERLLQRNRLGARQRLQVARPVGAHAGPAREALRQQAHAQRIAGRVVVAQDGAEVRPDQEGRPARAGRQQDRGIGQRGQRRALVHGAHALGRPLARGLALLPIGAREVEARRQPHLHAPGLAGLPARVLEEVRGRGRDVGHAVPDVAPAVAVGIDRMREEHGRQELRLAHRAGPGTDHAVARDVAALQDLQRRHQLLARPAGAPALEAQRGERVDGRDVAVVGAVVALHAPDRDHDLARHAVARGHRIELGPQRLQPLLAARHALGRDGRVEVVPDRAHELGLAAVALHHLRQVARAVEGAVQGGLVDAGGARLGAELRDPALEVLLDAGIVGDGCDRRNGRRRGGARRDRRGLGLRARGRRRGAARDEGGEQQARRCAVRQAMR